MTFEKLEYLGIFLLVFWGGFGLRGTFILLFGASFSSTVSLALVIVLLSVWTIILTVWWREEKEKHNDRGGPE